MNNYHGRLHTIWFIRDTVKCCICLSLIKILFCVVFGQRSALLVVPYKGVPHENTVCISPSKTENTKQVEMTEMWQNDRNVTTFIHMWKDSQSLKEWVTRIAGLGDNNGAYRVTSFDRERAEHATHMPPPRSGWKVSNSCYFPKFDASFRVNFLPCLLLHMQGYFCYFKPTSWQITQEQRF